MFRGILTKFNSLKIVLISVFFINLTVSAYAQQNDLNLTDEERAWLKQSPVVRVANDMAYPPYDFVENGQATGFAVDYLDLIAEKVGFKVEFVNGYSWDELMRMLKDGEIDLAHSLAITDERLEYLDFSEPYVELPAVIFGRTGSEFIDGLEDLEGKRIAIVGGWAVSEDYLRDYPQFEYVKFDTVREALIGLAGHDADLFINTASITNYVINKNFIPGLEVIGREDYMNAGEPDQLMIATRKDKPFLGSLIRKGMAAVTNLEFAALSRKWQAEYLVEENVGLTIEEYRWLSENNTFKVAADPTIAPIEFIGEDGRIQGIAGSYLNAIADKLNIRFEWSGSENWAESLAQLQSREADVISAIIETEERRDYLEFTDPYVVLSNMIFAREGSDIFGNMDGLAGKRVAQVKDSAVSEFIQADYPDLEMIFVNSISEALNLVATGRADAHIGDIPISSYHIAEEGLTQLVVVGETPYKTSLSIGIRSDYPIFVSSVRKAMAAISEMERAAISREWLSLKLQEDAINSEVWRFVGIALTLLTVIMILIWNYSLRKEVGRRKIVEEQLRTSREDAHQAQQEAESANHAKSAFLANMSHEIRTPLNAIIGFSELMSSGVFGEISPPKYKGYADDIKKSGEHLATVVNDILDLSKIEAGKWQLHEDKFMLDTCIKDAFKMVENPAKEKQIELVYDDGLQGGSVENRSIQLFGDISAFKRAVINLLSNSIKFTQSGGKVACTFGCDNSGAAVIKIDDNGIGIPEDRLEQVMNPFEQVHGAYDLNEEGTGLGLPIVKRLIELHDGKFSLSSKVNVGTSATISIPAQRVVA